MLTDLLWVVYFIVWIPSCLSAPISSKDANTNGGLFDSPAVFITISAHAGFRNNDAIIHDRRIVLNWNKLDVAKDGSYIGLFKTDPSEIKSASELNSSAVEIFRNPGVEGSHQTSVQYARQNLTSKSEKCLGYWIAYVREKNVLLKNCFKIYPLWMHEVQTAIENRPLHSIMIPGTHNAGSWKHYDGINSETIVVSYVICQEDSIYQQLIHGIRYLDLRIAYYNETEEKFWINHDMFQVRPLNEVLQDVKTFVEETKEIVFVDVHQFPFGFNDHKIHEKLIQLVKLKLGKHLAPRSLTKEVTPKQLWNAEKTIIFSYADSSAREKNEELWPNVRHAWGDTDRVDRLEKYLNESNHEIGCTGQYWSAMAEITATFGDIFDHPNFGLRGFANLVNPKVTKWYEQKDWYSRAMIISTDFYLGNNLIEMAFKANENKAICNF